MSIYLKDIPLQKARQALQDVLVSAGLSGVLGTELIPLDEHAAGRVLAEAIWAPASSPHYHASAMDGFALRSQDTLSVLPSRPISLSCPSQAAPVDTGDPLPEWADAVIPVEEVEVIAPNGEVTLERKDPAAIRIRTAVAPWTHIRPMGEDIVATQLVLPAGTILRPVDLGALAACGCHSLPVARKPRVAILPTGSELVDVGVEPEPGQIIEFNSIILASQVTGWGGEPTRYPITADDLEMLKQRVKQAAVESDLVLINAGSSAGSEDYTSRVVESLGKVLVHGVAVRPGHPVLIGLLNSPTTSQPDKVVPVIGVPGYPVSAALTGEIFIEPLLAQWMGRSPDQPQEIQAFLTHKITSPPGDDDYVRVVVGRVGHKTLAAPISRGAGVISSLSRADGITIIPRGTQGVEAGQPVQVRLYRSPREIENTLLVIGSHDLTLDLLAKYLSQKRIRLSSSNAGSLGGLLALQRGEAHMAGSHLLDTDTGGYNLGYIQRYLPDVAVRVIAWVNREQGLICPPGNPQKLKSLTDLTRENVTFVNRQRGAGTRILLDYEISRLGIEPSSIRGYEREEYTHLSVAAAVASGRACCGLGVAAAARALNLDFIPLYKERYDLVIPSFLLDNWLVKNVIDLAQDADFRKSIQEMPGYDTSIMGQVIQ